MCMKYYFSRKKMYVKKITNKTFDLARGITKY